MLSPVCRANLVRDCSNTELATVIRDKGYCVELEMTPVEGDEKAGVLEMKSACCRICND